MATPRIFIEKFSNVVIDFSKTKYVGNFFTGNKA